MAGRLSHNVRRQTDQEGLETPFLDSAKTPASLRKLASDAVQPLDRLCNDVPPPSSTEFARRFDSAWPTRRRPARWAEVLASRNQSTPPAWRWRNGLASRRSV